MVFPFTAQPFVVFLTHIYPQHLEGIIHSSSVKKALVERAVVGLFRFSPRLLHREELVPQVFESTGYLLKVNPPLLLEVAPQMAAGVLALLKSNISDIREPAQWKVIISLLTVCAESPDASTNTMLSVLFIISNPQTFAFRDGPFLELVDLLLKFVATAAIQPPPSSRPQSPLVASPVPSIDFSEKITPKAGASDLFDSNAELSTPVGRGLKAISVIYYLHTQV